MPRGDRTGPGGMGQMTGRGMGYCTGTGVPGCVNSGGRGRGAGNRGFGGGFGFGTRGNRPYYGAYNGPAFPLGQAITNEQETDMLKHQAEDLTRTLGELQTRIDALEKEGSGK